MSGEDQWLRAKGQAVRKFRKTKGLTQEGLASKAGVDVKTIQRIEQNKNCKPESLAFVAQVLGVEVTDLLESEAAAPASPDIARHTCSFESFAHDRAAGFRGRDFVFIEIGRFLADAGHSSGYFVLLGDPGIGKSAILARLFEDSGQITEGDGDFIFHFNIALQGINTPRQFIGNVCAQLIGRYGL